MNNQYPSPRQSLVPVLFLVCGLFVGIALDRTGWLPGGASPAPSDLRRTFEPFWEAWRLVNEHYVDRPAVQPQRMMQGAIQGMLDSLGDVGHTTYLTAAELKEMETGLSGELEGIGATISIRDHRPTIVGTIAGAPARQAGLKPGDTLLEVNGKSVVDESPMRVAALIRGKAGTEVKLRISRVGQAQPLEISVTRAKIEVPAVSWHMLPGTSLAHLYLREFGTHTDDQLRQALTQIREAGAKALIVDVRANPGGLLEQAVAVTSEFLNSGVVLIQQDAKGRRTEIPVIKGGAATDLPLCVLVDEGTGSAAEIFAGALQDHERGKLVGTRTFGTGTVLKPFALSDGSAVLLAVSEWLTPKGRRIWHQGIQADVQVALPPGASVLLPGEEENLTAAALAKTKDAQLLKAIEVMTGKSITPG